MTKITWRGAEGYAEGETPPRSCTWGGITFPVGVAVEVDDPAMIGKARGNRFFAVDEPKVYGPPPVPAYIPVQWREPATEADPADWPAPAEAGVSFFDDPPGIETPPDYPPEDNPDPRLRGDLPLKRKRGRPPKVREAGNGT